MTYFLVWLGLVAAYILGFLAERRRHQSNYYLLMSRGAIEKSAKLMRFYYKLPWVVIMAAGVEYLFRSQWLQAPFLVSREASQVAMSLIMGGFLLRLWVMSSLGWFWTKRLLGGRGLYKLKKGPYRIFSHPEYLARFAEGSGFCLFLGSAYSGYSFLIISAIFYILIVPQEMKHLLIKSGHKKDSRTETLERREFDESLNGNY
jgi:methyltransferase